MAGQRHHTPVRLHLKPAVTCYRRSTGRGDAEPAFAVDRKVQPPAGLVHRALARISKALPARHVRQTAGRNGTRRTVHRLLEADLRGAKTGCIGVGHVVGHAVKPPLQSKLRGYRNRHSLIHHRLVQYLK